MPADDVTGALLRSVSRTFFLSVRALPGSLREPVGIAYLLARTSDTIADSTSAAAGLRAARLEDFDRLVRAGPEAGLVAAIQRDIRPVHDGERSLVAALPRVLDRFGSLPPQDRQETRGLLATIVAGQLDDLRTFADPGSVTALPDAAALDAYTYAVAGCVGEWWTRLGMRHLPRYSDRGVAELLPQAAALGKGLQLVNILRDMPVDLAAGRCYLPADELRAVGVDPAGLRAAIEGARPVFDRWLLAARGHLRAGRDYIRAVRPWRVRFACYVPWRLAERTLDLMERSPPLATSGRVKLSRGQVRGTLVEGLAVALGARPVR